MIVNMKAIKTPYHWFLSIHMLDTYTTSRTSTKDREIQLRCHKVDLYWSKSINL